MRAGVHKPEMQDFEAGNGVAGAHALLSLLSFSKEARSKCNTILNKKLKLRSGFSDEFCSL